MPSARDAFRLAHGGEIREALIMLESEDGGFELPAHGWLDVDAADGMACALVRSSASGAVHLLLDNGEPDSSRPCRWRPIGGAALHALQHLLLRMAPMPESAIGAARPGSRRSGQPMSNRYEIDR
jgi:hypothetical protein